MTQTDLAQNEAPTFACDDEPGNGRYVALGAGCLPRCITHVSGHWRLSASRLP